ncbi:methyl-accepting chemotaxis (MCP) signaling domain protein [Anoxybacillus sp. B7M1]|jgi:methyl-accepting chemotaxis protein|uniref:methyl-accepting chemotaxis protein n=1 Tax=unclassified Anoxybacillus TaxID=2639704 RepID=UPI0005CD676A|nr:MULTISPECIES: methyl-accepting chemotaxis protein [unclassified Anoxybacillus]ANB58022.1 methyl-accepting chemotaxis (MCP) signaling domain protein [Anoxybacillus sp. B2M1]ANB65903.1 methyl-accepting chemotaxis (MCP) signaling domain protein [Anoxybacillus sp. B7M1]
MFLLKRRLKENGLLHHSGEADNRHVMGQIQVAADQLKGIIEQMKLAAHSLDETSSSSKESTVGLTAHLEKTVNDVLSVAEKIKKIEAAAVQISAVSQEIHSSSQLFYEELARSWESLKKLQEEMAELRSSHQMLLRQMDSLVNRSQEINQILSTIGAISQRTSILALNANIESARAGEHGKGFSVVANEVGNLAGQTSKAVEQTREILSLIQKEIALSTDMVKKETEQIEHGSKEMTDVLYILDTFKGKLSGITGMVSDSTQAVEAQTESIQEIALLLDEISNMSVANKEYAQTVAKDMDRQHQNVQQIMRINEALEQTSNELQGMMKQDHAITIASLDEQMIEEAKKQLFTFLQTCPLYKLDERQHQKYLNEFLRSHSNIEAVWSNRLDGTFVYSNPPAGLVNAKARPWFIEASKGNTFISDVYISALTKKPCLTISAPILHQQQIVGVVGVDLSVSVI